jgi:hypothetical protein
MRKRLAAERASFIEPCLPSPADKSASGSNWIHEIKHDGFRLMARRDPVGIHRPRGQRLDHPCLARIEARCRNPCYLLGIMLNDLMTAFLVAFAAVTASGLLSRIWEYF